MKFLIKKSGRVSDIQQEFNNLFPYLKIELFKNPHTYQELSPKNEMIDSLTPLGKLINCDAKALDVDEKMTVGEFENLLQQECGLFVQVFRKSGRIWIGTSLTDTWTLEKQNKEGQLMSSIHDTPTKGQVDWNEWELQ